MKCVCYDRYEKNMCENFKSSSSIFDFTVKDLQDKNLELSKYDNGKVLLIVNFATNDELADRNFLELKDLKLKFSDAISILLFPCCQFGDPMAEKESSEIYCWCKFEGIEFADVFSMIDVNGHNAHPVYRYLTQQKPAAIEWNFTKFLVDKRGQPVKRFNHKASFNEIEEAVKVLL